MNIDIFLNPELKLEKISELFKKHSRVQIHNVLDTNLALELEKCLINDVPWGLSYFDKTGAHKILGNDFDIMQKAAIRKIEANIQKTAKRGFGFRFQNYMMVSAYIEKRDPGLLLHQVVEKINQPAWLNTMRDIIGEPMAMRTDAQATKYSCGDFLKLHNDYHPEHQRLAAYVINLTSSWDESFGGLLKFKDKHGKTQDSFYPEFNSMSLFKVPCLHYVSKISDLANRSRYSITGWIRL